MIDQLFGVDAGFFAVLVAVSFFSFLVSSTFGVGGALLLIPLLAQRMPAAQAVALSAPILLFNNVLKSVVFLRHVDKRALWLVSALALPASTAGAFVSADFDDRVILLSVAALIVLSLVIERALERKLTMSARALLLWGGLTGAISGLCGAAGPPTALGLKSYGLSREAFVGTVAVFAVLLQLCKIPAYLAAGSLDVGRWPLAAALSSTAVLAVVLAPRLLRSMPVRMFQRALDVLLLVSAVFIVVDVARR